MTTMAGRRLRKSIKEDLVKNGVATGDAIVVIAGLSNAYTDYTTTFEEYQEQRYEAGSTVFGPHQLSAYIQVRCFCAHHSWDHNIKEYSKLVLDLAANTTRSTNDRPEDFSNRLIDTGEALHSDHLAPGASYFGQVLVQPEVDSTFTCLIVVMRCYRTLIPPIKS